MGTPASPSGHDPAPARTDRQERALDALAAALAAGDLEVEDLERLLARASDRRARPPSAASVLYALGAAIIFVGCAIALATVWRDLPRLAHLTVPFAFPVVALAASVGLHRRGLGWQSDAAGLGGMLAYAAACGVTILASGWADTVHTGVALVLAAAVGGIAISVGLFVVTGSVRLLWIGAPLATAVAVACLADLLGIVDAQTLCWAILAEAAAAGVISRVLRARRAAGAVYMEVWALVGAYAAVFNAATRTDMTHLNIWHGVLAVAVILAFIAASETEAVALLWLAAAGGVAWVVLIAIVVGSKTSIALAVILAGLALVVLGILVARLHRRRHGSPSTPTPKLP